MVIRVAGLNIRNGLMMQQRMRLRFDTRELEQLLDREIREEQERRSAAAAAATATATVDENSAAATDVYDPTVMASQRVSLAEPTHTSQTDDRSEIGADFAAHSITSDGTFTAEQIEGASISSATGAAGGDISDATCGGSDRRTVDNQPKGDALAMPNDTAANPADKSLIELMQHETRDTTAAAATAATEQLTPSTDSLWRSH